MPNEERVKRAQRLGAAYRRWSRVHYVTGLAAGLWLALMALSGVLINHQEELGLVNVQVPNRYLPPHYTDEFRPDSNGLNVVLGDLHSGRFFGPLGAWIGDLAGLALLVSISSGGYSCWIRRQMGRKEEKPKTGAASTNRTVPN